MRIRNIAQLLMGLSGFSIAGCARAPLETRPMEITAVLAGTATLESGTFRDEFIESIVPQVDSLCPGVLFVPELEVVRLDAPELGALSLDAAKQDWITHVQNFYGTRTREAVERRTKNAVASFQVPPGWKTRAREMTSLDRLLDYAKTRGGDLYVLTRHESWSSALGEERIFQDGPTLLRSLARCECERLRKGERPGVSLVTISPEEDGVAPEGQSAAYVPEQAPRWLKDYHLAGKVALYFGRGSSELSPSARSGLDRIVRELRPLPGAAVAIQAWADSLTGSRERNELLSEERYQAIHRYLARALGSDVRLITGTGLGQAAERRADVYLLQPPLRTGNGTR